MREAYCKVGSLGQFRDESLLPDVPTYAIKYVFETRKNGSFRSRRQPIVVDGGGGVLLQLRQLFDVFVHCTDILLENIIID